MVRTFLDKVIQLDFVSAEKIFGTIAPNLCLKSCNQVWVLFNLKFFKILYGIVEIERVDDIRMEKKGNLQHGDVNK